jgi:hypothetical protein
MRAVRGCVRRLAAAKIGRGPYPPHFFGTAHSKGLTKLLFVSAHSTELNQPQLRPKPDKTRCLVVSAHSKGLKSIDKLRIPEALPLC